MRETLEEAAEKYAEGKSSSSVFREAHIKDFMAGAKWQAERMYSEEDLELAFNAGKYHQANKDSSFSGGRNFITWLKEFKNE